jgi:putative RNA 2'-phosphotransferase
MGGSRGRGAIAACDEHAYFEGGSCPICGAEGRAVLEADRRTQLSTFLSGALRHFPEDAGLSLDDRGWADYSEVVDAVTRRYDWAEPEHVEGVILTDPKGRFERAGERVRAAYGHSVDVTLDAPETPVPDELYHGTTPGSVEAIREEGLKPMDRQRVHLSETVEEAREVGRRRAGDPTVFAIDTAAMAADGRRIVRRGRGVYTTDRVPPEYLSLPDGPEANEP